MTEDVTRAMTADERAEYEAMLREAARQATTRDMGAHLVDSLRDAEQAGRRWASWLLDDCARDGATKRVKRWSKQSDRVRVAWHGEVISKPRVHSVPVRGEAGRVAGHQLSIWSEMSREQLVHKLTESLTQRRAAEENIHIVSRLLQLLDEFPDSADVGEALAAKGTTLDEYLGEVSA